MSVSYYKGNTAYVSLTTGLNTPYAVGGTVNGFKSPVGRLTVGRQYSYRAETRAADNTITAFEQRKGVWDGAALSRGDIESTSDPADAPLDWPSDAVLLMFIVADEEMLTSVEHLDETTDKQFMSEAEKNTLHAPVTTLDSEELEFTLAGQQITASVKGDSIGQGKLKPSVNAILALAETASQPGHPHVAADITDFDAEVANNPAVVLNTAKRSYPIEDQEKLAAIDGPLFLGLYASLAALQTAHPTATAGQYAHVDTGVGGDVVVYVWDVSDATYKEQAGASTAETPASIKTKYESNPNTNAYTDAEKAQVALTTGTNTGDQSLGHLMKFIHAAWVPGATYQLNDVIRDGDWTMIANKTTTDRPAPIEEGLGRYVYQGTGPAVVNTTAKQIIYGTDYTGLRDYFIKGYRLNVVAGNYYEVVIVHDPAGVNEVEWVNGFTAASAGWREFGLIPRPAFAGTRFTLLVIVHQPDPLPTTWAANWNYAKPTNNTVPTTGKANHAANGRDQIWIHKVGDDAVDHGAALLALHAGDILRVAEMVWSVQSVVDMTTYVKIFVAPAAQASVTGVKLFTFETKIATSITYQKDVAYYAGNPQVRGAYVADGSYNDVVYDTNAYGADIYAQEAYVSPDWDVVAYNSLSTAAGDPGPGGHNITENLVRLADRDNLDFDGTNFDLTDDAANNANKVNLSASAIAALGKTAGHTITDGGTTAPQRAALAFLSTYFTINDTAPATQIVLSNTVLTALGKANTALQNVVEDTTPELGGTLECNEFGITEVKGIDIAGQSAAYGALPPAPAQSISWTANHTYNFANVQIPSAISFSGTHTLQQSGFGFGMGSLFGTDAIIKNDPAITATFGPYYGMALIVDFRADSKAITQGTSIDVISSTKYSTTGTAPSLAVAAWNSFATGGTIGAGVTMTAHTCFAAVSPTVTGTLTGIAGLSSSLTTGTNRSDLLLGQTTIPAGTFNVFQGSALANRWNGSHWWKVTTSGATSITLTANAHHHVLLSATATVTVNLPDPSTCVGVEFKIKKTGASGTINIASSIGNTFDGVAGPLSISTQYDIAHIISNGATWTVLKIGAP